MPETIVYTPKPIGDPRFKSWTKVVTDVNRSRMGGFMYEGAFVRQDRKGDYRPSTLFLAYGEEGSRRHFTPVAKLYRLEADGTTTTLKQVIGPDWAIDLREAAEKELTRVKELKSRTSLEDKPTEETLTSNNIKEKARLRFNQHALSRDPDLKKRAKKVAPAQAQTPNDARLQKEWFRRPNELDFEGIDTPDALPSGGVLKEQLQIDLPTPRKRTVRSGPGLRGRRL